MTRTKSIVVVTSDVPFVEGGHIVIARSTVKALREYGYEADLVLTPQNRFGRQLQAYAATRLTDFLEDGLGRRIHQVISFRFPSYAVKHPLHVCWLNHRMREYYDLWDLLWSQLGIKSRIKEKARRKIIHWIDSYLLKHNVTKLFAQSRTIQARLTKWGNIKSEVLYPPPPQREYRTESYENYIFSVSRLHKHKRVDLLVESFRYVKNRNCRAFIMGQGPEMKAISQQVKQNNLQDRIVLIPETDEATLLHHYARCRAVFFSPLREDYGLVTAEAFASRKSVITTYDSGGPAELVKNNQTGLITAPEPEKIAEKIDELAERQDLAETMGKKAHEFISRISWENTVKSLVICDK